MAHRSLVLQADAHDELRLSACRTGQRAGVTTATATAGPPRTTHDRLLVSDRRELAREISLPHDPLDPHESLGRDTY